MEVKMQRFQKGELIDTFRDQVDRLERRSGVGVHTPVFDLLRRSEDVIIERADELCWSYDWMPDFIPFIPVFPQGLMDLSGRMAMVRDQTSTRPGVVALDQKGISDLVALSSSVQPYMLMGVFHWRDPRVATTPEEARKVLAIKGRVGLSVNEVVATALQGPLYSHGRDKVNAVICALGSLYARHQHDLFKELEVPAIYFNFESPVGPCLSSCIPTAPSGPLVYMPFCIERMELTG